MRDKEYAPLWISAMVRDTEWQDAETAPWAVYAWLRLGIRDYVPSQEDKDNFRKVASGEAL